MGTQKMPAERRKLLMGDAELVSSFRQAKDQRQQIEVLADLNCCSPFDVAARLSELGALEGTGIVPSQCSNVYTPVAAATNSTAPRGRMQAASKARGRPKKSITGEAVAPMPDVPPVAPSASARADTEPTEPKPCKEAAILTVAEFLAMMTELLTPAATKAGLVINGAPVSDITLIIRSNDHRFFVEVETMRCGDGG